MFFKKLLKKDKFITLRKKSSERRNLIVDNPEKEKPVKPKLFIVDIPSIDNTEKRIIRFLIASKIRLERFNHSLFIYYLYL